MTHKTQQVRSTYLGARIQDQPDPSLTCRFRFLEDVSTCTFENAAWDSETIWWIWDRIGIGRYSRAGSFLPDTAKSTKDWSGGALRRLYRWALSYSWSVLHNCSLPHILTAKIWKALGSTTEWGWKGGLGWLERSKVIGVVGCAKCSPNLLISGVGRLKIFNFFNFF